MNDEPWVYHGDISDIRVVKPGNLADVSQRTVDALCSLLWAREVSRLVTCLNTYKSAMHCVFYVHLPVVSSYQMFWSVLYSAPFIVCLYDCCLWDCTILAVLKPALLEPTIPQNPQRSWFNPIFVNPFTCKATCLCNDTYANDKYHFCCGGRVFIFLIIWV